MLTIYIACLVFGGVLVAMSMFAGHDTAADHDIGAGHGLSADNDIGAGHGIPADHDIGAGHGDVTHDLAHAAGHDVQHDAHHEGGRSAADAVRFLSFRNIVFFMAFFGLTGAVLTSIGIHSLITFLFSGGMGFFAAQVGYRLMRYLKRTESGAVEDVHDLRGHIGTVSIGCSQHTAGKVTVLTGGHTHTLIAVAAAESDTPEFHAGERVIISRIEQGVAYLIDAKLLDDHPPTSI